MNPFLKQVPCMPVRAVQCMQSTSRQHMGCQHACCLVRRSKGHLQWGAAAARCKTGAVPPSQPLPSPTLQTAQGCHINKSHFFLILCCFSSLRCFLPSFLVARAVVFCIKRKPLYIVEEKLRNLNENTCSASERWIDHLKQDRSALW